MPRAKQKPLSRASIALPNGTLVQMPSSIIPQDRRKIATHDVVGSQDSVNDQPLSQDSTPSSNGARDLQTRLGRGPGHIDTTRSKKRKAIEENTDRDGVHSEVAPTQSSSRIASNAQPKNKPFHDRRSKKAKNGAVAAIAQESSQKSFVDASAGSRHHVIASDDCQQSPTARGFAPLVNDVNGNATAEQQVIHDKSTEKAGIELVSGPATAILSPMPPRQAQDSIPTDTGLSDCPNFPGRLEEPAKNLSIAQTCERYPNSLFAWRLDPMFRHKWGPRQIWNHLPSAYKSWLCTQSHDREGEDFGHVMRQAATNLKSSLIKRMTRRFEFLKAQNRLTEIAPLPPQQCEAYLIEEGSSQTQVLRSTTLPVTSNPTATTQVAQDPARKQPSLQNTVGQADSGEPTRARQESGASSQMSAQNLNRIVIDYLNKKGYTRTEAVLRAEIAEQGTLREKESRSASLVPPTHSQARDFAAQTRPHNSVEVQATNPTTSLGLTPSEAVCSHEKGAAPMCPPTIPQSGPQPQVSRGIRPEHVYRFPQLTPLQKYNYADGVMKCWDIINKCSPTSHEYKLTARKLGETSRQLMVGAVPSERPLVPQEGPRPGSSYQGRSGSLLKNQWTYCDAINTVDNRRFRTRLVSEYIDDFTDEQVAAAYQSQFYCGATAILDMDSSRRIYRLIPVFDVLGMWEIRAPASANWRRYDGSLDDIANAEGDVRYFQTTIS